MHAKLTLNRIEGHRTLRSQAGARCVFQVLAARMSPSNIFEMMFQFKKTTSYDVMVRYTVIPMTPCVGTNHDGAWAKPRWLLSGSGVVVADQATRVAMRAPRRALPRCRVLWTNWKKPR